VPPEPVHGVLNALKPPGMTSHDVVDELRRLTGMRRIGHAGTLDPGACGVLVLCLGHATRIAEFLTERQKGYRTEFTLGVATDSGDAYGTVTREADAAGVDRAAIAAALAAFVGVIEQTPPMVSAVHKAGRRLYEHARRGETVEVAARNVEIYECRLLEFAPGPRARVLAQVECSKGTYVRALARDLGDRLGVGAHASFVLRTRAGRFEVADSLTLEEVASAARAGELPLHLLSADAALADLPAVDLTPAQRQQVIDGRPLSIFVVPGWRDLPASTPIRLRDGRGLVALARIEAGRLQPYRLIRGGVPS
jgi:tRNA pseudouridine55 synthase